jgi:phosphoheptose isomerase
MDLHQRMTEALEEHLTVIQQLTAASSLILQIASELVTTLRRQGKVVLCGNAGYPCTSRYASGIAGPRPDREYRPVHGHQ